MREIVVDNFACGGGASEGIENALGRPVDVVVHHCRCCQFEWTGKPLPKPTRNKK